MGIVLINFQKKKIHFWLIYVVRKQQQNNQSILCFERVVFEISLSVIKVLFSLTEYSLSCSFSVLSADIG